MKNSSSLSRTQLAAFRRFCDLSHEEIQSNHYLNGIRACKKAGLIVTTYGELYAESKLTPAGEALKQSLIDASV